MVKIIKTGIWISFFLFNLTGLYAQIGKINGAVTDEFGPLPGASVQLIQAESEDEVRGVITDSTGSYSLLAEFGQNYYLRISFMGYETSKTNTFQIPSNRQEIEMAPIEMIMKTELLHSVTVAGNKRMVSFSNGKMKVDLENSPMAKGESTFSLLPQIPGISVSQNGEIQVHGKSGVQVMINGQKTLLKGDELKTYLESLPASALSGIELETGPSAAQDAEGGAGILNLIIKRNRSERLAGSATAGYTIKDDHFWNGNVFLSKQHKKWNWSLIADLSENGYTRNQQLKTNFNETSSLDNLNQTGKEKVSQQPVFSQLRMDYDISETTTLGISVELGNKKTFRDWNSESFVSERNNPNPQHIQSFNNHQEKFDYGILSAYYKWKTDTLGSGFHVSANVSKVKRNLKTEFKNEHLSEDYSELFRAPASNAYQIASAKADYNKRWQNNMEFKIGVKFSRVQFRSRLDFFEIENSIPIPDPERSNDFDYDENIWANYLELSMSLHDNLRLNTGLRMEKTYGKGIQHLLNTVNKKNYTNWFPNISLNQTVNENYQIDYAYTKRITRPQYDFLNPQIFYIDPYNVTEGNPHLKPQITHTVSINHLIKNKYQIGIHYDFTKDYMAEVPITSSGSNQTSFSTQNINYAMNIGINAFLPLKILNGWNMNNSLVANYQTFKLDLEEEINRKNEHLFVLFQNQQQIQLPGNIQLHINIGIRSPFNFGYYRIRGQWWADAALKKSLWKNKLDLSLKFTDIFKSTNVDVQYQFNNNRSTIKQYMGIRSAGFHLTYKFGGENGIEKNPSDNFEEFERVEK